MSTEVSDCVCASARFRASDEGKADTSVRNRGKGSADEEDEEEEEAEDVEARNESFLSSQLRTEEKRCRNLSHELPRELA